MHQAYSSNLFDRQMMMRSSKQEGQTTFSRK